MPEVQWVWPCQLCRVVDGDTCHVYIDAGFNSVREEVIRLLGINCPEMNTQAGKDAREFVEHWFDEHYLNLIIQTHKSDAFGRYLGTIWAKDDGSCLNDELVKAGHAVVYEKR